MVSYSISCYSQITIDDTFTTQEIIEDILISSPCAEVSNFSSSTGVDFNNNPNGIGVFNANGTDFTFESGVILSSGDIFDAPGPNEPNNVLSSGTEAWLGDADLEANTNASQTNNASFIQFDFTPSISTINFNFLMASEEYDQNFECQFSDAFAFILIDQNTGDSQNLAVLPGTNTPIEVTNIHPLVPEIPGQGIPGCPAINEEFFDQYNFLPFNNPETSAIAFNGQTKSLTATGNVIAGNPYTIKLVVADDRDTAFDTAIFLEANSFNLGLDLGDDLTLENGNALCDEVESIEIGVEEDPSGAATYQWFTLNTITQEFEEIVGETNPTFLVNDSGTYQIEAMFATGCTLLDQITIEFAPPVFATQPENLILCDTMTNDGSTVIDFTATNLISEILNGQDPSIFLVTFHSSQEDAENGSNPLSENNFQNTINPQTIFARVTAGITSCSAITSFTIQISEAPLTTIPEMFRLCLDNNGQVIPAVEGNPSPPNIDTELSEVNNTFKWFLNGILLKNETNANLIVSQAGQYRVEITNIDTLCSNTYTTSVFSSSPPINVSARVTSLAFAENRIIEVSASGSNSIIYSLDDGPFQDSNIFENVPGGTHTITVKDSNGCGTTTLSILVLYYRQLLTPNGDGFNDTWNLDGIYEIDPNAVISIFDRYGKLIAQLDRNSPGWDGTYVTRPLPSTDYWFSVDYFENPFLRTFRGHFTLKR